VPRWTRRLLLGAVAVLVPVLAGCEAGNNAPTLMFHPASYGTSETVNGITIDDAFVLGPALNSALPAGGQAGVFLSLSAENGDRLVSAAAPGAASSVRLVTGPVTLSPYSVVDLSGPQPRIVLNGLTSPLSGGQMVNLVLDFATAGAISIQVPVEPASYDYTTYSPAPTPTPTHTHTPKASASATGSPGAPPAAGASPSSTAP
jgi:copper(I)-binding protein